MVPENTEATIMLTVKLGDKKCQWLLTHADALHAKYITGKCLSAVQWNLVNPTLNEPLNLTALV